MSDRFEDLPPEIQERVLSFIGDREDGTLDDEAMRGLIAFIVENADAYPSLLNLVKLNEERVIEHAKETGQVQAHVFELARRHGLHEGNVAMASWPCQ